MAAGTQFSGIPQNCPVVNPAPQAFVRTAASTGTFQSDFKVANLKNLICNVPGVADSLSYPAGGLTLNSNQAVTLANGKLIMQGDGNLVLYDISMFEKAPIISGLI